MSEALTACLESSPILSGPGPISPPRSHCGGNLHLHHHNHHRHHPSPSAIIIIIISHLTATPDFFFETPFLWS
jgi:hypothetical protein